MQREQMPIARSRRWSPILTLLSHRIGMRRGLLTKTLKDARITQASSIITSKLGIYRHQLYRYYIFGGRDLSHGALSSIWCADISSVSKI